MHEKILTFPPYRSGAPLWISLAGESWCDGSYRIGRSNQSVGVIEYVIAGRGMLTVEGHTVAPEAGDVYIAPPYTTHQYRSSAEAPWNKLWFNFDGPLLPSLLAAYGLAEVTLVRNCRLESLFRDGLALLERHSAAPEMVAVELGMRVIAALGMFHAGHTAHSGEGEAMRQCVERNLRRRILPLAEIAQAAGRSESQAIRIFRREFGQTPYAYWLDRKMETAALLLRNSAQPVKAIAAELGFADEYYFSNLFKRKMGVAPSFYRNG